MADFLGRLGRRRLTAGAVALVALTGLGLLAFSRPDGDASQAAMASYQVVAEPFVQEQAFAGRIVPGEQVEVLAPTDATIIDMAFAFGDRVEAGQTLFRLDPADVWRKGAEARIAYLQAQDTAHKMQNWSSGPEMRRAERGLETAQHQLQEVERRHVEGRRLFDRGLIARAEMDGLDSSLRQARQTVLTAQEDYDATRARGSGVEAQVAHLQRGLAETRMSEATAGTVIAAPRAGIMVRPSSATNAQDSGGPKVGGKVNTGQSLGVVAALDGLDVLFRVDEADLALLKIGTGAEVTGPGFAGRALSGELVNIAGEAETVAGAEKTQFAARVRLAALSPEDAARLRIGMTAHVKLKLYEAPQAIAVPVAALVDGGAQVRVRLPDGRQEIRAVTLGRVGPDRAEVVSGLKVGETVVWPLGGPSA